MTPDPHEYINDCDCHACMSVTCYRLRQIEAAARNLIAQRGRHNTEIAYKKLEELLK